MMNTKNIAVCCDGTWNKPDFLEGTNVWKIYNYMEGGYGKKLGQARQVKYYDTGVGTGKGISRFVGGISGAGLIENIFEAYRFVCAHYEPGDRIFIFGFSRGAYTARALSGVLNNIGVLTGDYKCTNPNYLNHNHTCFDSQLVTERNDTYDFKRVCAQCKSLYDAVHDIKESFKSHKRELYKEFKTALKTNTAADVLAKKNPLRELVNATYTTTAPGALSIEFLGVWDTVSALGIPSLADVIKTRATIMERILRRVSQFLVKSSQRQYAFIDNKLSANVKHAYHAISVDERRGLFPPVLWDEAPNVVQEWFAGVHSNVGGGYSDHSLSDIPLISMIERAKKLGLVFDTNYKNFTQPNCFGLARKSHRESFYRYLPARQRKIPMPRNVHPSVYRRMTGGLQYVPTNVFRKE